jgi:hypothetical protein
MSELLLFWANNFLLLLLLRWRITWLVEWFEISDHWWHAIRIPLWFIFISSIILLWSLPVYLLISTFITFVLVLLLRSNLICSSHLEQFVEFEIKVIVIFAAIFIKLFCVVFSCSCLSWALPLLMRASCRSFPRLFCFRSLLWMVFRFF